MPSSAGVVRPMPLRRLSAMIRLTQASLTSKWVKQLKLLDLINFNFVSSILATTVGLCRLQFSSKCPATFRIGTVIPSSLQKDEAIE